MPSPTKSNIHHLTKQILKCVFSFVHFHALVLKDLGVWGRGYMEGVRLVYLLKYLFCCCFLCFWHAFSLLSVHFSVCNVLFLFEHLFTYYMIDSDLQRASFIFFHSLLSQFDSVLLKWGNSGCYNPYFAGFL